MTRVDALAIQEQNARSAAHARIDELEEAARRARIILAGHALPSTAALCVKAAAVREATEIWDATAHALAVAVEHAPSRRRPGAAG